MITLQQNQESTYMATYPVFLSHSWVEQDGVERITSLMETYRLKTEGFGYEYYSVSKDDPAQFLPSNKALALSIEKQMKPCSCLIILAGVFEEFKRWANLELDAAKKLGIPVILVEAADPKHTSHKEKRAAAEIVKWDAMQLGDAIVRHARPRKPS